MLSGACLVGSRSLNDDRNSELWLMAHNLPTPRRSLEAVALLDSMTPGRDHQFVSLE